MKFNVQIFVLVTCYFLLLLIVLPYYFKEKVYSPLSTVSRETNQAIEKEKFEYRVSEAMAYLSNISPLNSKEYHYRKFTYKSTDHLLILLVHRDIKEKEEKSTKLSNLTPLSVAVDEIVRENIGYAMLICDVTSTSNLVVDRLVNYYPKISVDLNKYESNKFNLLKHAFDSCIRRSLNSGPDTIKSVTIFNDNVIPYRHFGYDLKSILHTRLNNKLSLGELISNSDNWLYLHLQEPSEFRDFQFDYCSIIELTFIAFLGSVIFYVIFTFCDSRLNSASMLFTTIFGGLFFITFAMCLGRPYLTDLRRLSPAFYRLYDPPEPIEFSAMTIPISGFSKLSPHFENNTCSSQNPLHEILDRFINTFEIPGYVLSPSLVRYV